MTSKMISFSICIPNYNYARYIGETIQSVLNQTYPHFEIVVVDNASTDNSVEVVKSFRDPRIKLFVNQYNVGFAPNLDRAAQRASNPYLIMLSSDDLMRQNALEEYSKVLAALGDNAEYSLLTSAYEVIDSEGKIKEYRDRSFHFQVVSSTVHGIALPRYVEVFSGLSVFADVFPRMSVPGPFCAQMYSRRLYELVGGYSSINPIGPDAHFAYKILLLGTNVFFLNKPLFAYRVHSSNQLSQTKRKKSLNLQIDRYIFSQAYDDAQLDKAGVKREQIARYLVEHECIRQGLIELANGSVYDSFRLLTFALSAYPSLVVREWKTYILVVLLAMGPVGAFFARMAYRLYRGSNK
jgi:glycosyltransferase involved in cell wall biosynthesis